MLDFYENGSPVRKPDGVKVCICGVLDCFAYDNITVHNARKR